METIQSYKKFIQDIKKSYGEKILKIFVETIMPGIKDILNDYSDHYESTDLYVVDANNKVIKEIDYDLEEIDEYTICIDLYIGDGDADEQSTHKLISQRILSEFGDDLDIHHINCDGIQYYIK